MTKSVSAKRFSKMSTNALLKKISKGGFTKSDAMIVASILERRCPKPGDILAVSNSAA